MSAPQIVPDSLIRKYARDSASKLREVMLIAGEAESWFTARELGLLTGMSEEQVSNVIYRTAAYRPYLKLESRYRGRVKEYKLMRKP